MDSTFQRRREIERMLLSGRKLTVPNMAALFGVGKTAIRRDFDIIGDELPLSCGRDMTAGISLLTV